MTSYVAAIDQGTTSTRCTIFSHSGEVVAVDQKEHEEIFPKAGWVEHDPEEVWTNTREVTAGALAKADLHADDIVAIGITNQRETAVVWDRATGKPVYNAIVWQDTRTDRIVNELGALGGGQERYRQKVGLPLATYFSGPKIRSSSEEYGKVREKGALAGVPISGILGDQQAATFGQACLSPGEAKNTYGTGNFVLLNTGTERVISQNGLLTTVGYKIGSADTVYALEGSLAVTGSLVQWIRDNLGMIGTAPEIEALASSVEDNGGCYFVPAFSGLFAPYWRSDARGAIVGLTRYVNKGHLARAVLEATAYQTREVIDAMNADSGVPLTALKVDGGMVHNELLMQFQADILDVPVIRPTVAQTKALGAAYAGGLAVGFWDELYELRANWGKDCEWTPAMAAEQREHLYRQWKKAVRKTFDWSEPEQEGLSSAARPNPAREE